MDQCLSAAHHFTNISSKLTMTKHLTGMMELGLLSFLLCSSLSSAMLLPDPRDGGRPLPPPFDPMDPANENSTTNHNPYPMPPDMPPNVGNPMSARSLSMPLPEFPMPGPPMQNMSGLSRDGIDLLVDPNQNMGISEPDMAYCQMLMESPVPIPHDQVPWFCLCWPCKNNGQKGDTGDRGLPGSPGSPGIRGLTGLRGRPGFVGRQGPKGQKGDFGERGVVGATGLPGTKGDLGLKGEKGDRGSEGPPGDQGPQGESGVCPASCDLALSQAGPPGLPGPAGARGLPGVQGPKGDTGSKGSMGDVGRPGAPGVNGLKGDHGMKGECNCSDGAKGAQGIQGPAGPKGQQGSVGPQGPIGLTGAKGDFGDTGMTGMPGPCSPAIMSSFSASLATVYPPPNMPVPFTRVLTNRQMNYNPSTGVYTAPINGTYVFSYHLVAFSKVLKVGLFLNFNPVIKTTESTNFATASQQVVLHLAMGDRVWLQLKDDITNGMYADSETSSTFSGFLLYPDSCDMIFGRDFMPPVHEGVYSWGDMPGPSPSPTPAP